MQVDGEHPVIPKWAIMTDLSLEGTVDTGKEVSGKSCQGMSQPFGRGAGSFSIFQVRGPLG